MSKVTYRIPTEMYAYVEVEIEHDGEPEVSEISQKYHELASAFTVKPGLDKKDFDTFMEKYLSGDQVHVEDYNLMSKEQQDIIQAIKRAKKRLQAKTDKSNQEGII